MDRETWRAAIHGVTKSRTRLSDWTELNWTEGVLKQLPWCLSSKESDNTKIDEEYYEEIYNDKNIYEEKFDKFTYNDNFDKYDDITNNKKIK